MLKIPLIMLGGGIGAVFRHLLFVFVQNTTGAAFPTGTLAVNLLGSFAIGLLWCLLEGAKLSPEFRFFIFTGLLGGFTTFSTFARETMQLFKVGEWKTAMIYVGASNVLGILLVFAGYFLAKYLLLTLKGGAV
jgi:CrcB protein